MEPAAPRKLSLPRQVVGAACLFVGAIPILLTPPLAIWAVLECGPANSSCHHPPYRFAAFVAVGVVLAVLGAWLVAPSRSKG